MFAENIVIPHHQSYKNNRHSLVTVINPSEIAGVIADCPGDADAVRLEAAQFVQGQVHTALRFNLGKWPAYQPAQGEVQNTIPAGQETNCLGYAAVTAELLAAAGVQNHIIYFGGHFMNGLVTGQTSGDPQIHMFDVKNPQLSQNITNTLRRTSAAKLLTEQTRTGRGAARIDTERLLTNAGHDADEFTTHTDTIGFNWLYYQKGEAQRIGYTTNYFGNDERLARRNRYTSFMSMYPYSIGMRVLTAYGTFKAAIGNNNYDDALASTYAIAGLFPELDARLKHDKIKALVSALATQNRIEDALGATLNYCTSFACSTDPRLKGVEAGLYYTIAAKTGDVEVAALGLHAYRQALGQYTNSPKVRPFRSDTFAGKMARIQAIIHRQAI